MEKINIYLIRHGRQSSSLCNVNVPLSQEGIMQSTLLGQRLDKYNIDIIYSSNLIRAVQTADILEDILKNKVKRGRNIEDIRELEYGEMTGLSDEVIKEKYKWYFQCRDEMLEDVPIPGGESGGEVYERMKKGLDYIINEAKEHNYKNIAIVSHGGAIRSLIAGIFSFNQARRYMISETMENCSINHLTYNYDFNKFTVERINDYAHLEGYDELLRKTFK